MKKFSISTLQTKSLVFFCLVAFFVLSQSACTSVTPKATVSINVSNKESTVKEQQIVISSVSDDVQKQLEEDWGIRVVGLRSTMSGLMVDFRYKIIDAKKASTLLDINKKSYLLVEKNQARLGVPNAKKVGALRQTTHAKKVKEGRDYFILFGNPGARYIKPGDKATLVIGDLKVEHMTLL
jgi:hypothetical protein